MKIIDRAQVASLIPNGSCVALSGSSTVCLVADETLKAIGDHYTRHGVPRDLTVFNPQGFGDKADSGVARFAHKGMCKTVISGHWGNAPKMGKLALDEDIAAYNLPQGVMAQLLRDMSAHGPGVITKIGLGTFVDPRQSGGRINSPARKELVELIELDGEEWLRYKPIPIDVAILRGTSSDPEGYISLEEEAHYDEVLAMAAAAKNNGGIVIVQVRRTVSREQGPDISQFKIPGYLVDYVVVVPEQRQAHAYTYRPGYCGAEKEPVDLKWPRPGIDERKLIARRQAMELRAGMVVNIGVGISTGIPTVLAEEGCGDDIILSLEQGQSGGLPVMGYDAGIMLNPKIILDHPVQHDLYHGGLLDAACLSAAEVDFRGNVNVSKFGSKFPGCGGFIDISQETRKIIFGGTFCAGSRVRIDGGRVTVLEQGTVRKFVHTVQQITFSGKRAAEKGRDVVYITERCVFRLSGEGLVLTEIAPGIDLERDILAQMDFRPLISPELRLMPEELFREDSIGLKQLWHGKEAEAVGPV